MFLPKASSQMLDRVVYVTMFVETEFLHGFHKTIWSAVRSVKIKLYVYSSKNLYPSARGVN